MCACSSFNLFLRGPLSSALLFYFLIVIYFRISFLSFTASFSSFSFGVLLLLYNLFLPLSSSLLFGRFFHLDCALPLVSPFELSLTDVSFDRLQEDLDALKSR